MGRVGKALGEWQISKHPVITPGLWCLIFRETSGVGKLNYNDFFSFLPIKRTQ
jgi:hypothetical protein